MQLTPKFIILSKLFMAVAMFFQLLKAMQMATMENSSPPINFRSEACVKCKFISFFLPALTTKAERESNLKTACSIVYSLNLFSVRSDAVRKNFAVVVERTIDNSTDE